MPGYSPLSLTATSHGLDSLDQADTEAGIFLLPSSHHQLVGTTPGFVSHPDGHRKLKLNISNKIENNFNISWVISHHRDRGGPTVDTNEASYLSKVNHGRKISKMKKGVGVTIFMRVTAIRLGNSSFRFLASRQVYEYVRLWLLRFIGGLVNDQLYICDWNIHTSELGITFSNPHPSSLLAIAELFLMQFWVGKRCKLSGDRQLYYVQIL